MKLTTRQLDVLGYIAKSIETRGYPPSRREMCEQFGWASTHAADDFVSVLERKGVIQVDAGVARGMRITSRVRETLERKAA